MQGEQVGFDAEEAAQRLRQLLEAMKRQTALECQIHQLAGQLVQAKRSLKNIRRTVAELQRLHDNWLTRIGE